MSDEITQAVGAPLERPVRPRAWLCELRQEDGTTRTQFVEQDPDGLRWNDAGEPSPYRTTPLFALPLPRWWRCDKHGESLPHNAWGCPECVVELRTLAREQAVEIQTLRDALNTAGGALFRLAPACIEDDDERERAEHARAVGLAAVESVLKRPVYVERAVFAGPNVELSGHQRPAQE